MHSNLIFDFSIDRENKTITVKREFAAPLQMVWGAWTRSEVLDQWWAPEPWKSETKIMDFKPGGKWLYAMVGPDGEKHWSTAQFKSVDTEKSFSAQTAFSDEQGNVNDAMPVSFWITSFSGTETSTVVDIVISYNTLDDMEAEINMGFKEGFSMGLGNLDKYLAAHQ